MSQVQPDDGRPVVLQGDVPRDVDAVRKSAMYRSWEASLHKSGALALKSVDVLCVDYPGLSRDTADHVHSHPSAALLKVDAGNGCPPTHLYLTGRDSVGVLPLLTCGASRAQFVVLYVSPRVSAGDLSYADLPGGSFDPSGNFIGTAAQELKLAGLGDINVNSDQLTPLAPALVSPATTDEVLQIFLSEHTVTPEWLDAALVRYGRGDRDADMCSLKLVPFQKAWRATRDARTICAIARAELHLAGRREAQQK